MRDRVEPWGELWFSTRGIFLLSAAPGRLHELDLRARGRKTGLILPLRNEKTSLRAS